MHIFSFEKYRKAWRQKIEAWLSENEKEERAGEELQRKARQRQANRRSFEDTGKISENLFLIKLKLYYI